VGEHLSLFAPGLDPSFIFGQPPGIGQCETRLHRTALQLETKRQGNSNKTRTGNRQRNRGRCLATSQGNAGIM